MSNSVQCFLEVSNLNSTVSNFIEKIEKDYAFNFKKINTSTFEFIVDYIESEDIKTLSEESNSAMTLIYYDTSIGYARKKIYNRGYLISDKSIFFSMDLEIEIFEKSNNNRTHFYNELDLYIEKHGEEEANFPKIGNFIKINELTCSDIDVLDWLNDQKENKFKVSIIELESNGLWVDGCEYRIDLNECNLI